MQKKFKLTKEKFINWYFSDSDDISSFGFNAVNELKEFGKVNITIQGLFDSCGYIPQWICEGQSIHDEEDLSQEDVELI